MTHGADHARGCLGNHEVAVSVLSFSLLFSPTSSPSRTSLPGFRARLVGRSASLISSSHSFTSSFNPSGGVEAPSRFVSPGLKPLLKSNRLVRVTRQADASFTSQPCPRVEDIAAVLGASTYQRECHTFDDRLRHSIQRKRQASQLISRLRRRGAAPSQCRPVWTGRHH
jgi:hypothetical protein